MWQLITKRFRKREYDPIRGMLSAYIDQCLSHREQEMVTHHLAWCEACRSELDSLRATVELLHRVPQVSPPRSFVLARVEPVPRRAVVRALQAATAVVAVLLALVFTGDMLHFFQYEVPAPEEEALPEERMAPDSEKGEEWALSESGAAAAEEGAGELEPEDEQPTQEMRETSWVQPVEIALGGVVVVLGGMTIINWRKGKKRSLAGSER